MLITNDRPRVLASAWQESARRKPADSKAFFLVDGERSNTRRWTTTPDRNGVVSERDELNLLRKAVREMVKQRDVLKRTAVFMIKEAGTEK